MITTEELQATFPYGSRWRAAPHELVVLGWTGHGGLIYSQANKSGLSVMHADWARRDWVRIPDPVPCPITEPTTLHSFARHGNGPGYGMGGPFDEDGGYPPLTLHPAEPGATEGRYTWEQP